MRIVAGIVVEIAIAAKTLWSVGVLYYSPLFPEKARAIADAGFAALTLLAFIVVFAVLVVVFFRIPASNDRDWQPEVAMAPYAKIYGNVITIHNVRNFDYRTETDLTPC